MPTKTIAGTAISALNHPISALEDQPNLSADDLKAYFDADPQQLCDAHNDLVTALSSPGAAASIGFQRTSGIAASTVQDAVANVQSQLSNVVAGSIPDNSITLDKLDTSIQSKINIISSLQSVVVNLQDAVEKIYPFCAQYPLMVLAMSEGCPTEITDEIATAALGGHSTEAHDIGLQLSWLCRWKNESVPSQSFMAKQTISDIFHDSNTLREIANHSCIYQLISMSSEIVVLYRAALAGEI